MNLAVLGLIHHNKSRSADPLELVMASEAFTAVARSVHTVVPDPDDETDTRRLFGMPKNNLGPTNLATLTFTIESYEVETEEGPASTGRLEWGPDSPVSIADRRTETGTAKAWLPHKSAGFPRHTYWLQSSESTIDLSVGAQPEQTLWGKSPTALTAPTGAQSVQSEQSEQSESPK